MRASEGGPFYSTNRSVPAIFKYGNSGHRHGVDKRIRSTLPPKFGLNHLSWGSADPWVWPNSGLGDLGPSLVGALLVGPFIRYVGARAWLIGLLYQIGPSCKCDAGCDILYICVASCVCFLLLSLMGPCKPKFTKTCGTY